MSITKTAAAEAAGYRIALGHGRGPDPDLSNGTANLVDHVPETAALCAGNPIGTRLTVNIGATNRRQVGANPSAGTIAKITDMKVVAAVAVAEVAEAVGVVLVEVPELVQALVAIA